MKTIRLVLALAFLACGLLAIAGTYGKKFGLTVPEHWGTHPVAGGY